MMAESVQPTGRLEQLSIEMEPRSKGRIDSLCDKYCSENMETKTKVYICLLLILPSLIYFLVSINFSSKKAIVQRFEKPVILNITTFSEEKFTAEEYSEAFDLAVKNDQLVVPTGFSSQSLKRYVSLSSFTRNLDDDAAIYLLQGA